MLLEMIIEVIKSYEIFMRLPKFFADKRNSDKST